MDTRVHKLITSILEEVITEGEFVGILGGPKKGVSPADNKTKVKTKGVYNPKVGDRVFIGRGPNSGETGEITYVTPDKTMADIEFDSKKFGRVATVYLQKEKKK